MEKTLLMLILLTSPFLVMADAPGHNDWVVEKGSKEINTKGSDASFDKRLPPVYPGETIDDSGKPALVWSTSGAVGGDPAREAPENSKGKIPNIEVIVDGRKAMPGRVHDRADK